MADRTPIEWTDATWNVINGCSVVSPGCTNCYAMRLAGTRFRGQPTRQGLTTDSKAGPVWNGQVRLIDRLIDQPLRWTRPRRIFVCAHGDLFHEAVADDWLDAIMVTIRLARRHQFQVLTKRSGRMRRYFEEAPARWAAAFGDTETARWSAPIPNLWLGVSVEDQARADERIPDLLATPAAVRWLSAEPLLGPVDLTSIQAPRYVPEDHELDWKFDALSTGDYYQFRDSLGYREGGDGPDRQHRIDWVVAGGESGPGARPMHPDWTRQLRDDCASAGVPFLFKQWGEWAAVDHEDAAARRVTKDRLRIVPEFGADGGDIAREALMERVGKKAAGRLLDGQLHDGFPEGLANG